MSDPIAEQPLHGETITPIGRPRQGETAPRPAQAHPRTASRYPWLPMLALGALLVAAVVAFWLLPQWTAERVAETAAASAPAQAPAPSGPTLTPEEIAALKAQGESLLGQLLPQQAQLAGLHAVDWAGEDWPRYEDLSRSGDDAFLANEYSTAVAAYRDAVALGETLLTRAGTLREQALAAGSDALAAGEPEEATRQFKLVLGIDAEQPQAKRGLARAERLPEVLELMHQASALEAEGNVADAAKLYRQASAIDALYEPPRAALARATETLRNREFESLMSRGFAALTAEDYHAAQEAFDAALALKPDAPAARDGLDQAVQGLKLDAIALAQARGLAFERRELWTQAINQYQAALATDETLDFAQTGLVRAQARADLDAKLENLIANPNLLFRDEILSQAGELLTEAQAVEARGPRLEAQTSELGRLIALASTPITIELHSDEKTEVTLYRVGALGAFSAKQVDVRPGTYTVVGSRNGYRDVRSTFTVLPGRAPEPITVQCHEPI